MLFSFCWVVVIVADDVYLSVAPPIFSSPHQVTSHIFEPFEKYLEHTYNPHLDSMNRFNFALLTYVRDLFNFT